MDSFRRSAPPIVFFCIILLFFYACVRKQRQIGRGYYFWRTNVVTQEERNFLKEHAIKKLYTRVLDVDWSGLNGAVPVGANVLPPLNNIMQKNDSSSIEVVPVIFITNRTFEHIDSFYMPQLAQRLIRRCLPAYDEKDITYENKYHFEKYGGPIRPREIQFDCDWTVKTAPKYFRFLQLIKNLLPSDSIQVSATIRLHQYKYFIKTGVPPVHRGMLMLYNLTDPKQYSPVNSIFDLGKAKPYFSNTNSYPLPLDIALPAWSWCLIFRQQKFYGIENELTENDLKSLSFLQPERAGFYRVTMDTVYRDLFLRNGDEIKAEGVDEKTLQQAAELARKAVNTDNYTVSFFELSQKEFKNYRHETFEQVYSSFH